MSSSAKTETKSEKIFVQPKEGEIVFFEGRPVRIPQEGAEVVPSFYYRRLIVDGSLIEGKVSNKKTQSKGA